MAESARYRGRLTWRAVTWTFGVEPISESRGPMMTWAVSALVQEALHEETTFSYCAICYCFFLDCVSRYTNSEMNVPKGIGTCGRHTLDLPLSEVVRDVSIRIVNDNMNHSSGTACRPWSRFSALTYSNFC